MGRIFRSKIFVLFICMFLAGFCLGYAYTLLEARHPNGIYTNTIKK